AEACGAKLSKKSPARVKLLNSVVQRVGYVNVAGRIRGNAGRKIKLSIPRHRTAPLPYHVRVLVELLNAMSVLVHNENGARTVDRTSGWKLELSVARAQIAPPGDKSARRVELLYPAECVNHVEIAGRINSNVGRKIELTDPRAAASETRQEAPV